MNDPGITTLVTYIEENLRASPTAGMDFVDPRQHSVRLLSKQNHVVFGRRGAGKTTLVKSSINPRQQVGIYLNLEDFKDITFPNIVIQILLELLAELKKEITTIYPWYTLSFQSRRIKRELNRRVKMLQEYLHEPDSEIQEVNTSESYAHKMNTEIGAEIAKGGASTERQKSRAVSRKLPKDKLEFLRIDLARNKRLLEEVSQLLGDRPILLILDDYYFVPKRIQPELVDYFHRLTKGTSLFLKLATIKHRSKLYQRSPESYIGVEVGHDIYPVDLDYTLDKFDELQAFMRQLLRDANVKSKAQVDIDSLFAGESFSQLCLASGGVPRDFLSLFVTLANQRLEGAIGKIAVNEAAIANLASKMESMKKDSGDEDAALEDYLGRLKRFVYDDNRTNAFLISKDDLESDSQLRQAIRELVDLRLIHLVVDNISKAPSDGRRYEAYILDVALYDNSRPRDFTQVEPGYRDEKARKDDLRASPVFTSKEEGEAKLSGKLDAESTVSKRVIEKKTPILRQLEISYE